jgi:hypothetical protein
MEAAIIHSNKKKLRQAHGTPFMKSPLAEEVVWMGTGPATKTMLDGTFEIPTQTDAHTAQCINTLKQNPLTKIDQPQ